MSTLQTCFFLSARCIFISDALLRSTLNPAIFFCELQNIADLLCLRHQPEQTFTSCFNRIFAVFVAFFPVGGKKLQKKSTEKKSPGKNKFWPGRWKKYPGRAAGDGVAALCQPKRQICSLSFPLTTKLFSTMQNHLSRYIITAKMFM